MHKPILCFVVLLPFLTGCPSSPHTTQLDIADSIGRKDYQELAELELEILKYKKDGNPSHLRETESRLETMITNPSLNKEFEARVQALRGEVLYYLGETRAARQAAEKAAQLFQTEPQLHLLRSLLATKIDEKIQILEEAREQEISSGRLLLELAELYFENKEFGKATGIYDEAFTQLPPPYIEEYQTNRELARQFIDNPPADLAARDYLGVKALLVSDVINILLLQSHYLEPVIPSQKLSTPERVSLLKAEEYIFSPQLTGEDYMLRKDIAYMILAVLTNLEGDPSLMHAYSNQFRTASMESPVPDVKVTDYFFDAVLNLVEREIMELPDGINFMPDMTLSGLELNEILRTLKQYYGI